MAVSAVTGRFSNADIQYFNSCCSSLTLKHTLIQFALKKKKKGEVKCAADCQPEGGQSGGLGPHQGLGLVGLMALIKALESGECLVAFNKYFF